MGQAAQAAMAAEPGQGEFTGRQWVFLSSQMQENSLCESKPSASCWELPCGWDGPGSWGKRLPALTTKREPLLRSYQGLGEINPANVTMNIKEMPESSKGSPGPFLKLKLQGHMARTLPTLAVRANINRRISVHHCVPCWGGEREKGTKCDTKVRQINVAKWVYSPKRCLESLEHKTSWRRTVGEYWPMKTHVQGRLFLTLDSSAELTCAHTHEVESPIALPSEKRRKN